MSDGAKKTVLIIDDEEKIVLLIQNYLDAAGFRTLCATSGTAALRFLQDANSKIDLIILDLMLPDISGEELCKKIRSQKFSGIAPNAPIIMLTAKVDEQSIVAGLNLGADDYMTKPFSLRELTARVQAALRRTQNEHAQNEHNLSAKKNALVINTHSRTVMCNGSEVALTANEYKILAFLANRPERIFTRDEIIAHVFSDDFSGFDRAVDTHIKNIRQKIGDDPKSPQYIKTVYGMGYRYG
ncbi:MAG: response regulator transcription factor [Treponemataceae bacterium]|nr:MAG: response regulator transcription factor [Treponemataceae bacterium]